MKVNRRFVGKRRLHLQGLRINQTRCQHEALSKQSFVPVFLHGLLFNTEYGGDIFLRNVG
jgi:hypothetical protein